VRSGLGIDWDLRAAFWTTLRRRAPSTAWAVNGPGTPLLGCESPIVGPLGRLIVPPEPIPRDPYGAFSGAKSHSELQSRELDRLDNRCYQRTFRWSRLGDLNPGPTHYEPFASPLGARSYSCILRLTPPCSAMGAPCSGSFPGHFRVICTAVTAHEAARSCDALRDLSKS